MAQPSFPTDRLRLRRFVDDDAEFAFDLHRNPLTPWLTPAMVRHIHDFETVLNARHPTRTDFSLGDWGRRLMQWASLPRYWSGLYRRPLELKLLQRLRRG